jgi:putative ABC transport system permease protein
MRTLMQDVKFGAKMLAKSPGFSLIAVLALALGIGGNTAMFSFVNAWVLHPLTYPNSDRLLVLLGKNLKTGNTYNAIEPANFYDYQRETADFEEMCAWTPWTFNLTGSGQPERVQGYRVSWNFFETLGVKPERGRAFLPQEDAPGAGHVAILSNGLWKTRYAGDPNILGRSIQLGGESYMVAGVMPAKFQLPLTGESNLWVPLALSEKDRADRKNGWVFAMGRLKPGTPISQAQGQVSAIAAQLEKAYPEANANEGIELRTLEYEIGSEQGNTEVMMLFWIVGLVLLIACANVANLMLARATGRTKELAVRTALGAGRARLIRQLVTETVLLFLGGSAAGALVAYATLGWIEAALPDRIRGYLVNYGEVNLDYQALLYTFGIAFAAGILFGLAPAISSTRLDVQSMLKESSGQASGSRQGSRLRSGFVVAEIALAAVIVICSSLLARSFLGLMRAAPGFQPDNVLVAEVNLPESKYKAPADIRNFFQQAVERVKALPQTEAVGATEFVPFGDCCSTVVVAAPDKPAPPPGQAPGAILSSITPGYFSTMQIQLLRGREFAASDGPAAATAVVVNQTLAKYFWPGEDVIGRKIQFTLDHPVTGTIVGVVQDVKLYNSTSGKHNREMYVPFAQFPTGQMGIVIRSRADRAALSDAVRSAVWSIDSDQPVSALRPLQTMMDEQYAGFQITVELMGYFSGLALFLGAIGIYAVMAFNVTQRTHEIGIRMALGAAPKEVLKLVLRDALRLTAVGVGAGVMAALGAAQLMSSMLYGVSTYDPRIYAGVVAVIAAVAVTACYIPVRRAMRVDPMVALRYE